jgi:hypothetical protein
MAQPTPFNRSENYTEYAAAHPGATFPPASLDTEMNAIETTLDATLANLALIQRDDGKLANLSVHPDALSAATKALIAAWTPRGLWATATLYTIRDVVEQSGVSYVCAETHTSAGAFATDTAAGRWINLGTGLPTAANVSFSPAGNIAASNVQAAIQELDTEKAPLASPALTGNPTAPTASPGDNDTSIATTAFVAAAVSAATAGAAPLASPTFTGNPAAPTPAADDNDTSIATTAFVAGAIQPQHSYVWNGDFRVWGAGTSAVPTGYGLVGSGATVARNTTAGQYRWGSAGVALTRAGTDCSVSQTVTLDPANGPAASWHGKTITVGAWVYATVADRAKVFVSDGISTINSTDFHPGTGLVFMKATMTVSGSATSISVGGSVAAGDTTAVFSGMTLVLGSHLSDSVISYTPRKAIIAFHFGPSQSQSANTTQFVSSAAFDATETNAMVGVPFKGVARNLRCASGGSTGATGSYIYTLRRGQSDSALSATISGIGIVAASDTANQVEYAANQAMCLKLVTTTGANALAGAGAYIEFEEIPV